MKSAGEARGRELRRDANRLRRRAVRLLATLSPVGELDQPRLLKHPHMEVQVPGVDAQPLRQLAVRQRLGVRAQFFEHSQPKRMAERLQLLGTIDGERVTHRAISNTLLKNLQ